MREEGLAILGELMGPGVERATKEAFEFMEVAEDEIAAAKERHPLQAPVLHKCFITLRPHGDLFRGKGDILYRAHCRELLDRVAEGGDFQEATKAELCAILCELSFNAPLEQNAAALYMRVFRDLFPDKAFADDDYLYQGSWAGAVEELEGKFRRKLRRELKRVPPGGEDADSQ